MSDKKYYWLKLKRDFFTDKRIKKLRRVAGGNTYTIIYLKMQLLSLQDEGVLYFEGLEDTFEEEIALQIDEDTDDVRITISFLLNTGLLVQTKDNVYELTETKMCIGSETRNAESMRKLREKRDKDVTLLQDVTKCYTEKEIEKEIEKDIEIYKKENKKEKRYFENDKLNEIFIEFLQIRKKIKAVNSDRAINTLLNKLNNYDDETKYKMIERSIVNSWKDVYELKEEKRNNKELSNSQKQNKILEEIYNGTIKIN